MGHIAKTLASYQMDGPEGWNPENGQYNLPFTVELKENFHIHWQDLRIEMMPEDFDDFVEALNKAHERWEEDGNPKEMSEMKRYGWWPGEEGFDWGRDRYEKFNKEGNLTHNFRKFPRTQSGNLHFDNRFQVELQKDGQYHIHYKNFRFEMGKARFNEIAKLMYESRNKQKKYGSIYKILGRIRFFKKKPKYVIRSSIGNFLDILGMKKFVKSRLEADDDK